MDIPTAKNFKVSLRCSRCPCGLEKSDEASLFFYPMGAVAAYKSENSLLLFFLPRRSWQVVEINCISLCLTRRDSEKDRTSPSTPINSLSDRRSCGVPAKHEEATFEMDDLGKRCKGKNKHIPEVVVSFADVAKLFADARPHVVLAPGEGQRQRLLQWRHAQVQSLTPMT